REKLLILIHIPLLTLFATITLSIQTACRPCLSLKNQHGDFAFSLLAAYNLSYFSIQSQSTPGHFLYSSSACTQTWSRHHLVPAHDLRTLSAHRVVGQNSPGNSASTLHIANCVPLFQACDRYRYCFRLECTRRFAPLFPEYSHLMRQSRV